MSMAEISSVIVVDCSGSMGLQILQKAVQHDLKVTAFTLCRNNIPEHIRDQLHKIIEGDVLNSSTIEEAVAGHDAVFCSIESYNMFSIALRNRNGFFDSVRKRYGTNAEYVRMMDILSNEKASIDWVAMMVPAVKTSQIVNPQYKVERNNMPGEWSVTSAETADFIVTVFLDQTSADHYKHNMLGISSQPKRPNYIFYAASVLVSIVAIAAYCGRLPPVLQQYLENVFRIEPPEN